MQDIHDERNIPLDPQPERTGLLADIRAWLNIGQARRNKREAAQAKAAEANRPIREAEARRALSQPGVSPDVLEKAGRMLGRLGKGEG
jgi:hypothetical protein